MCRNLKRSIIFEEHKGNKAGETNQSVECLARDSECPTRKEVTLIVSLT